MSPSRFLKSYCTGESHFLDGKGAAPILGLIAATAALGPIVPAAAAAALATALALEGTYKLTKGIGRQLTKPRPPKPPKVVYQYLPLPTPNQEEQWDAAQKICETNQERIRKMRIKDESVKQALIQQEEDYLVERFQEIFGV